MASSLPCKRLQLDKKYKTLEPVALEVKIGAKDMIIIGIYGPPRTLCGEYQLLLEEELSEMCNWASLQKGSVAVIGDINLDRLRPDKNEGKLLLDLEAEQGFECLINKPTRTGKKGTITINTLIHVLLSNKPDLFKKSGVYYPVLSDHSLIYGIMKEKIRVHQPKVITFRSYKNFDSNEFKKHLSIVPWHVAEILDNVGDQVHYWSTMMKNVVDEHLPL